jgi:YidC/Oxa1 family membrane protein insertase
VTAVTDFLRSILEWINSIVANYGWSIIIFTMLIRVVLMPLEVKSRKGMLKMQKLQPQLTALQKKYANDKQKLSQKQSELYKKAHYSPLSGCLPLLIQMPILFAMFAAMRAIANEQIIRQVFDYLQGKQPVAEGWFWVKNIWMADSPFASIAPDANTIKNITWDVWHNVLLKLDVTQQQSLFAAIQNALPSLVGAVDFGSKEAFAKILPGIIDTMKAMPAYQLAIAPQYENISLLITTVSIFKQFNGLLLLPVLAGVSQMLMTKLNPAMQQQQQMPAKDGKTPGTGNFMKYFFPLFSVYICLTSNAGFALYWVTVNIISSIQSVFITRYLENKEKRTVAVDISGEGTIK